MASTAAGATSLGATAGAGGAALRLKFIFANHDGVVVEFETDPTTLVKDLKVALMGQWPTGERQLEIDAGRAISISIQQPQQERGI